MISEPNISIIIATYNRAHFILEMLKSVQKQSHTSWECLIIDDGGNDNTAETIAPLLEEDARFSFFKRTDDYKKGLPGARNYGLDLARGKYLVFFDDDDLIDENLLKIALNAINGHDVDFCHYQKKSFEKGQVVSHLQGSSETSFSISKDNLESVLRQKIGMASCTVLWKSDCFKDIRFNENLMYAEEWECYSRIISNNFNGISIPDILYFNRKHPESNTGEFYRNDTVRRASKAAAILLVLKNLKEKKLLSRSILRYFITMSSGFKEFDLFAKIIHLLGIKNATKWKWQVFYFSIPFRIPFYRLKKSLTKNS
jgi:GalNAc5-diNAcBac-PP-undecaprenol beta-1,3-glucosyltransferase